MTLTPKQRAFVAEYLLDLNATQGAIRAGYSSRTAQEQASRLLSNVMVQTAIHQAQQARAQRTELAADQVVKDLVLVVERWMQRAKIHDAQGRDVYGPFDPRGDCKALDLLRHLQDDRPAVLVDAPAR